MHIVWHIEAHLHSSIRDTLKHGPSKWRHKTNPHSLREAGREGGREGGGKEGVRDGGREGGRG